jgi:hypothetical protein
MSGLPREPERLHVADQFFFEELRPIVGVDASYQWLSMQSKSRTTRRDRSPGRFVSLMRAARKGDSGKYQSRAEEDHITANSDVPNDARSRHASLDGENESIGDKKRIRASKPPAGDKQRSPSAANSILQLPNLNGVSRENVNISGSSGESGLLYTDAAHMVID